MKEMFNLFLLGGDYINGYNNIAVYLLGLASILSGVLVIISKNPIISLLYLIILFTTISLYLILLGIHFIGLAYLLVYIGAVSILFIFILMLIDVRDAELVSQTYNNMPLVVIVFFTLFSQIYNKIMHIKKSIIVIYSIWGFFTFFYSNFQELVSYSDVIKKVFSSNWDIYLHEVSPIAAIGNLMYTSYSIWLILTSVILLLAMVGCIVITKNPNTIVNDLNITEKLYDLKSTSDLGAFIMVFYIAYLNSTLDLTFTGYIDIYNEFLNGMLFLKNTLFSLFGQGSLPYMHLLLIYV